MGLASVPGTVPSAPADWLPVAGGDCHPGTEASGVVRDDRDGSREGVPARVGGASLPGALWARAGGDPIMSRLIVMPHKKARSWPQLREDKPIRPGDRCAHVRSIARVMEHTYRTDAHFAAY